MKKTSIQLKLGAVPRFLARGKTVFLNCLRTFAILLFIPANQFAFSSPLASHFHDVKLRSSNYPSYNILGNEPQWILDKTVSNVDFYYMLTECDGNKAVFLKFENRNDYKVKISWKEDFVTRQVARRTEGAFGVKQLMLSAGATLTSDCSASKCKECLVLPDQVSPAYRAEIVQFGYKDIAVAKVQ